MLDEGHDEVGHEGDAYSSGDQALHGKVVVRSANDVRLEARALANVQQVPPANWATGDPSLVGEVGYSKRGLLGLGVRRWQEQVERVVHEGVLKEIFDAFGIGVAIGERQRNIALAAAQ
jgi:hypothetical protein